MTVLSNSAAQVYDTDTYFRELLDVARRTGSRVMRAFGSTFALPKEMQFIDLEHVEAYCNRVLRTVALADLLAGIDDPGYIKVRTGKYVNQASWTPRSSTMRFPQGVQFGLREVTVVHELGHVFGGEGHGGRYRAALRRVHEATFGDQFAFLYATQLDIITRQQGEAE